MDTLYRIFLHIMSPLLTQDLGNSMPSARTIAVTNFRLRNASCPKKRDFKWVLPFRNMHNPYIFFVQKQGLLRCSFKKNIIIFGTAFKALLVRRLHQTLLIWVSKAISKANASTNATRIWNSGQILMCWMWSSASVFRSSNSGFLLMTELWVLSLLLQTVVFSLTSAEKW